MNKPKIIFLTGYAESGKDSFANIFCTRYCLAQFAKVAYAKKLKIAVSEMFNIPMEYMSYADRKKYVFTAEDVYSLRLHPLCEGKSPREIMQWFGTEIMRNHADQDFWVKAAIPDIQEALDEYYRCIITDTRLENEITLPIKAFPNAKPFIIRIERPGNGPANSHVSEKAIIPPPGIEYIVFNAPQLYSKEYHIEIEKIFRHIEIS